MDDTDSASDRVAEQGFCSFVCNSEGEFGICFSIFASIASDVNCSEPILRRFLSYGSRSACLFVR